MTAENFLAPFGAEIVHFLVLLFLLFILDVESGELF